MWEGKGGGVASELASIEKKSEWVPMSLGLAQNDLCNVSQLVCLGGCVMLPRGRN